VIPCNVLAMQGIRELGLFVLPVWLGISRILWEVPIAGLAGQGRLPAPLPR